MKKQILMSAAFLLAAFGLKAQLYSTQSGVVGFFSKTPVEDIKGDCRTVLAVMNISTRDLAFSINNTAFAFENKLMQDHFNEKYMESEKYPVSNFKGKINENIDLTREGEYEVTVTGKLNIHGVVQDRTIPGKVIVKEGKVQLISNFKVKNADHKIEIPSLVSTKIAEEIDVNVDALLLPKK